MAEDHVGIFARQCPLHPALGGIAERIERGAAQEFEARQEAERLEDPAAEFALAQMPGHLVAARQQGRRQLTLSSGSPSNCSLQRSGKFAVGIKPGHLILVLVGHQLEQALCKGFGQLLRAGEALASAARTRATSAR